MARVAITVQGAGELTADMDPRFGRAGAFLLIDLPSGAVAEKLENQAAGAAHGAGTGAAAMMSKHDVTAVISGRFGPKAYDALKALEIEMWLAPAGIDAQHALDRFVDGSLERMMLQRF